VTLTSSQSPGVAVSPDGIHAYVTENLAGRLSTITLDAAPLAANTVGSADPATGPGRGDAVRQRSGR
jgi:DNA-binding beta-propeller fold protein YncE